MNYLYPMRVVCRNGRKFRNDDVSLDSGLNPRVLPLAPAIFETREPGEEKKTGLQVENSRLPAKRPNVGARLHPQGFAPQAGRETGKLLERDPETVLTRVTDSGGDIGNRFGGIA